MLSQVLDVAVRDGELSSNPCQYVNLPKITRHGKPPILLVKQWAPLFSQLLPEKHGPLFVVMLLRGVRPREALALTWGNLPTLYDDTTPETYPALSSVQALTMVERSRWTVGPVKTQSGRRLIPLPTTSEAVFRLQRQRVRSSGPDDFIFPNAAGSHQNPDTSNKAWQRTLKRHGLPPVKLYATRHSRVTVLLAAGIHRKVVAERHGHSSRSVTIEGYSHVLPSMSAGALRALPDRFAILPTERSLPMRDELSLLIESAVDELVSAASHVPSRQDASADATVLPGHPCFLHGARGGVSGVKHLAELRTSPAL